MFCGIVRKCLHLDKLWQSTNIYCIIYFRRNFLTTKRLNIFAPTAEEDGDESALGKEDLF